MADLSSFFAYTGQSQPLSETPPIEFLWKFGFLKSTPIVLPLRLCDRPQIC